MLTANQGNDRAPDFKFYFHLGRIFLLSPLFKRHQTTLALKRSEASNATRPYSASVV